MPRTVAPLRLHAGLLLLAGALVLVAPPAFAQEGLESYPAAYFAANQPPTALEMVALLPGFHIQTGDATVRGFSGTVGNVLIDGQLPTSKEENVNDLLARIAASSVDHIELIRGAADMHGYAVLANVVRIKSTSLKGRAIVEEAATHYGATQPKLALHLTRQGAISTTELSATWWAADIGAQNQNGFGTRKLFNADGTVRQLSNYSYPKYTNSAELSASHRQPVWDGDLALGVALKSQRAYSNISEQIYFPSASLATGLDNFITRNGEGRLDYTRNLNDYGQLQLFAVHRLTEQDETSITNNSSGSAKSHGLFNTREDVARLAWHRQGALKLEAGVEGAINVMSSRSTLTQGGVAVILPAANIRLEEKRVELFSTGIWRFDPTLITELGARFETSTLTQSGDSTLTKDLSFLKPRWLTTWDFAPGNQFRLLLERQVGQLVFRNFASSTSLNSNIVTAGNKNLEPARSWNVSLDWESHFWKRGSLVLEVKREFISKVVDYVPVFSGTKAFNAVGNIGNGVRDGLTGNLILPLDELGLEGVTVTGSAGWHHSKVRDPATGQFRQVVGGQTVGSAQFVFETTDEVTWDLPERNLEFGLDLHAHADSHEADYRIDEIDPNHHGFKLGLFVEYKPVPDWTLRVFDKDIAQTAAYRDRYVYAGLRGTSPLSFIERRQLSNGAMMGINIQHDF